MICKLRIVCVYFGHMMHEDKLVVTSPQLLSKIVILVNSEYTPNLVIRKVAYFYYSIKSVQYFSFLPL